MRYNVIAYGVDYESTSSCEGIEEIFSDCWVADELSAMNELRMAKSAGASRGIVLDFSNNKIIAELKAGAIRKLD